MNFPLLPLFVYSSEHLYDSENLYDLFSIKISAIYTSFDENNLINCFIHIATVLTGQHILKWNMTTLQDEPLTYLI